MNPSYIRNGRTELVLISSITQFISLWNSQMRYPAELGCKLSGMPFIVGLVPV